MGQCIGRPKGQQKQQLEISSLDEVRLQMEGVKDSLSRQIKVSQKKIDELKTQAVQLARDGHREQAKLILVRSRLYQKHIEDAMAQQNKLTEMSMHLEMTENQAAAVEVMRKGSEAEKALIDQMGGADGVAELMDTIQEQREISEEINGILRQLPSGVEEDVENELDAMDAELAENALDSVYIPTNGPVQISAVDERHIEVPEHCELMAA